MTLISYSFKLGRWEETCINVGSVANLNYYELRCYV